MNKERLAAFTDAVLAIIMTILVLELEKPKELNWNGLWDLRTNFFAYALSFFWLGFMWLNHHNAFEKIEKVSNSTIVWTLVMLFFASLFPYTTGIVAGNFNNSFAQVFYGVIIILVSLSNIALSNSLNKVNKQQFKALFDIDSRAVAIDLSIKVIGIILSMTIFPPAVMIAVFINVIVLSFLG